MIYRGFGRTGLSMPIISCGGMRYQHKWDDIPWSDVPRAGQENLEQTIAYAIDNGINHIETARGYGSSEMQLGFALKRFPREKIVLQTKVGPKERVGEFREVFSKSLKYLQQDYIDLLSIHGINNRQLMHHALKPGGALDEARRLQKEGRIRHIGFSTHAPAHQIVEIMDQGDFDYVNLHWYFINQLNGPAIEAAAERDMGVFIISPNDKGGRLYNPPEKLKGLCQPLDPMAFNDLFCWSNQNVHTVSCGAACPSDFDTHLEAAENANRAPELVAPIAERIYAEVARHCGDDWLDTWHLGIPEWDALPNGINVKETLRLWTWAKSIDLVEFGKWRYNMLGNASHWVPGNPVSDYDQAAMQSSLKESPHADRIPEILEEARSLFADEPVNRLSRA